MVGTGTFFCCYGSLTSPILSSKIALASTEVELFDMWERQQSNAPLFAYDRIGRKRGIWSRKQNERIHHRADS